VTGLAKPVGIATDPVTQQVFFNEDDQSGCTGKEGCEWPLSVVDVSGQGKKQVIPKLLDPQGISLDTKHQKVYYAEHHGRRVGVVDYDGKNQKVLHQFQGSDYPSDVVVDVANNKMFALVEGLLSTGNKLVSMDLDGSNMKVLNDTIVRAYGLTLDRANKQIYYINGGNGGFIGNVNYEGKDWRVVLVGLDWPYMLDFDPVQNLLVFSTTGVGDGQIRTVTPDGLNVTQTLSLGFAPMGVAFGKVPLNPVA
jgi:DNA-binding beta-propeller fold protein YncE